jgi:hypothetical protein
VILRPDTGIHRWSVGRVSRVARAENRQRTRIREVARPDLELGPVCVDAVGHVQALAAAPSQHACRKKHSYAYLVAEDRNRPVEARAIGHEPRVELGRVRSAIVDDDGRAVGVARRCYALARASLEHRAVFDGLAHAEAESTWADGAG